MNRRSRHVCLHQPDVNYLFGKADHLRGGRCAWKQSLHSEWCRVNATWHEALPLYNTGLPSCQGQLKACFYLSALLCTTATSRENAFLIVIVCVFCVSCVRSQYSQLSHTQILLPKVSLSFLKLHHLSLPYLVSITHFLFALSQLNHWGGYFHRSAFWDQEGHYMVNSTFAYGSTECWLSSNQVVFTVPTLCPLLCRIQNNTKVKQESLRKCFIYWMPIVLCSLYVTFTYSFFTSIYRLSSTYQDLLGIRKIKINMMFSGSL